MTYVCISQGLWGLDNLVQISVKQIHNEVQLVFRRVAMEVLQGNNIRVLSQPSH